VSVTVRITVHNAGPHTIWAKLCAQLGRDPTNEECKAEIFRLLDQFAEDERRRIDRHQCRRRP
jgi:hypothetical protein